MLHNRLKKSSQILAHCLVLLFFAVVMPLFLFASNALAETRSLKLYYVHTREREEIVFKRNGRYDQAGLKRLNYFLRDWRRNEPTKMDPRLFDLVWTVYQLSGSRDYIHVVSAYRSPATNNMLRSRSKNSGVAKNSQHTLGHAMDFYIPDVKLTTLRALGMKQGVGGVGYYPTSGSPFMHMDTGNVRHWPRMSRRELMALFPDGKTMHVPSDGKPLQGYQQALAEYKARNGQPASSVSARAEKKSGGGLFGLFGRKNKAPTPAPTPQQRAPSRSAPSQNEPQNEPDDSNQVLMAALPNKDAPIPAFSPTRDIEEDDDEAAIASFGNVPLPDYKPGNEEGTSPAVVEQNTVDEKNTGTTEVAQAGIEPQDNTNQGNTSVANVPIPVPMPSTQATSVAMVDENPANENLANKTPVNTPAANETTVAEVVMPASFPVPTAKPQALSNNEAVQMASATPTENAHEAKNGVNNQVIAMATPQSQHQTHEKAQEPAQASSSNMNVPVMAYAGGQSAKLPEARMVAASDHVAKMMNEGNSSSDNQKLAYNSSKNNNKAVEIIPVPKDDDEVFDRNKKVRGNTSAAKSVLNQMGAGATQVANTNGNQGVVINNELREIPSVVFVSRLEKDKKTSSQYSSLSGHAVDFHPVTKVYK